MVIKAKAPLRLGLAGGGTDVSPYSDEYGGIVLNATIDLYAYAMIEPRQDHKIVLNMADLGTQLEYDSVQELPLNTSAKLLAGVYNYIAGEYGPLSFTLTTSVDAVPGSGLGTSSTLTTAIVGAFVEWLKIPLGEYDIARLAYKIEREYLGIKGGKQDQYAATFGGFNYMEFYDGDQVIVNPLRIRRDIINELELSLLLYYIGKTHNSSDVIQEQIQNMATGENISALHALKEQAIMMKKALLYGNLHEIGEILDYGWQHKKKLADTVSDQYIDNIYNIAKEHGAIGGKLSGAGGGGFMMLFVPQTARWNVIKALQPLGGEFIRFHFVKQGLETWTIL